MKSEFLHGVHSVRGSVGWASKCSSLLAILRTKGKGALKKVLRTRLVRSDRIKHVILLPALRVNRTANAVRTITVFPAETLRNI